MPEGPLLDKIERIELVVKDNKLDIGEKLKELEHRTSAEIKDFTTETRERLQRADIERAEVKDFQKTEFREINRKIDILTQLARDTNGRVNIHEDELFGKGSEKGIKSDVKSLVDSRTWITILVGFICTSSIITWTLFGTEIRSRGIVNKTQEEEISLIKQEIWKHANKDKIPNPDN